MFRHILFLIPFLISCESLEPATQAQCETLYNHLIALTYQKDFKDISDPKLNQLENDLIKSISTSGVNLIFDLTGEKDKIIRRCEATLTRFSAKTCIETKNKKEWEAHCSFKIE